MSLQDFIATNHEKLVSMTREKVAKRSKNSRPDELETKHGVHVFLDPLRQGARGTSAPQFHRSKP